jgi:hypothetical protein
MALEECHALSLPFVGNKVDFAFYQTCAACDEDGSVADAIEDLAKAFETTTAATTVATSTAAATSTLLTTEARAVAKGHSKGARASNSAHTAVLVVLGVLIVVTIVAFTFNGCRLRRIVAALQADARIRRTYVVSDPTEVSPGSLAQIGDDSADGSRV